MTHPAAVPVRPTWIEVSRAALTNNLLQVRALLHPGVQLMAVVKANAYGHGAVETARTLAVAGADQFAVATLGEALELRQAGIAQPLLVLGYTPGTQAADALAAAITLTIFDLETAATLNAVAAAAGGCSLPVHVKVNTGMNRLGLRPEETPAFLSALQHLPHLRVEGLFTHFATSDEADRTHSEVQFARFASLLTELAAHGLRPPVAHAANSAAILTMPHTHLELVRSGIALYGLDPDAEHCPLPPGYHPALTWKAVVTQVSSLQPGDAVSYGREFVADRPLRAAVIPVGYADGFPRRPHTYGSVLIRGSAAPILGRVCMDQSIVDITAIERATGPIHQGEEVVLLGSQGAAAQSAECISARVGTNNYDIVSRILARVPRMYVA